MTEHTEAHLVEKMAEFLRRQGLDEVRAVGTARRQLDMARPLIQQQVLRDMYEWHRKHNRLPDIRHYAKEKLGIDL